MKGGQCISMCLATALMATVAGPALAADDTEGAKAWLDRLAHAMQTLSYRGDFVYQHDGKLEAMRIVHAGGDGNERERLVHLNGTAREVVRDHGRVTCIFPDRRAVMVEKSRRRGPFPAALAGNLENLTPHYALKLGGTDRMAGRSARLVAMLPKDSYRYGHRIWMDERSGLLLKSELLNEQGEPIEQIMFTNLEVLDSIPQAHLEPDAVAEGYTWFTDGTDGTDGAADSDEGGLAVNHRWHVEWLPGGFNLISHTRRQLAASPMPVEHMLFSDGLASVSVFIDRQDGAPKAPVGATGRGAINAFSRIIGGQYVTVVGEVPQETTRRIAGSIVDQSPTVASHD
jgi:sigma-E factor negative regulatory protein RseB